MLQVLQRRARAPRSAYPGRLGREVGIWTGVKEESLLARRSSNVGYYDGEA